MVSAGLAGGRPWVRVGLGQMDIYLQKSHNPTLHTKINSEVVRDQHGTANAVRLLEENIGINLCDLGLLKVS